MVSLEGANSVSTEINTTAPMGRREINALHQIVAESVVDLPCNVSKADPSINPAEVLSLSIQWETPEAKTILTIGDESTRIAYTDLRQRLLNILLLSRVNELGSLSPSAIAEYGFLPTRQIHLDEFSRSLQLNVLLKQTAQIINAAFDKPIVLCQVDELGKVKGVSLAPYVQVANKSKRSKRAAMRRGASDSDYPMASNGQLGVIAGVLPKTPEEIPETGDEAAQIIIDESQLVIDLMESVKKAKAATNRSEGWFEKHKLAKDIDELVASGAVELSIEELATLSLSLKLHFDSVPADTILDSGHTYDDLINKLIRHSELVLSDLLGDNADTSKEILKQAVQKILAVDTNLVRAILPQFQTRKTALAVV